MHALQRILFLYFLLSNHQGLPRTAQFHEVGWLKQECRPYRWLKAETGVMAAIGDFNNSDNVNQHVGNLNLELY